MFESDFKFDRQIGSVGQMQPLAQVKPYPNDLLK